jgi:hypothetical protein
MFKKSVLLKAVQMWLGITGLFIGFIVFLFLLTSPLVFICGATNETSYIWPVISFILSLFVLRSLFWFGSTMKKKKRQERTLTERFSIDALYETVIAFTLMTISFLILIQIYPSIEDLLMPYWSSVNTDKFDQCWLK